MTDWQPEEGEGIQILESACRYLAVRAEADEDEQLAGEYEAFCILEDMIRSIQEDYTCQQCDKPIPRRAGWCSARCRAAYDL